MSERSSSPSSPEPDQETRDLRFLFDAFSSDLSLEDIASAYARSNGDPNVAGQLLCDFQIRRCRVFLQDNGKEGNEGFIQVRSSSRGAPRSGKVTSSTGIVSAVVGKGSNARPSVASEGPPKEKKPLKLDLDVGEPGPTLSAPQSASLKSTSLTDRDMEDFLFKMLHEGFNLDMQRIQQTLRSCGYNVEKSMEELLEESSLRFADDHKRNYDNNEQFMKKYLEADSDLPEDNISSSLASSRDAVQPSSLEKEKLNLSEAILEALFTTSKRPMEEPKKRRLRSGLNKPRAAGKLVVSPPNDVIEEPTYNYKLHGSSDVENDNYEILRTEAKQHWDTMKENYKSAFDAFEKGDSENVKYFLEQGNYYNKMAREADEQSTEVISGKRQADDLNVFILDLHDQYPKEAIDLLKNHLRSLAGAVESLKVIIDTGAEDITKGKRRRWVIRYLEKKSICWTEEEGGLIFNITMNQVDPEN